MAMKKVTERGIGAVALLVLLTLLAVLAAKRRHLTAEEATDQTVRAAVNVQNTVLHDKYALVALVAVITLFAFVTWTALRANPGEDQAMPPAGRGDAIPPSS
jgi:hypothetical protein